MITSKFKIPSPDATSRMWIAGAFVVLHAVSFLVLYPIFGRILAAFAFLPLMIVSWFWGVKAGVVGGFGIIALNAVLYHSVGESGWAVVSAAHGGLAGSVALIAIGLIVGSMRNFIRQKERILAEKNREILEYVDTITHDLKKPLATIKNVYELVESETHCNRTTDCRDRISIGKEAVGHMQELLDDLLACAQLESGLVSLHKEKIRIPGLVDFVAKRFEIDFRNMKIEFRYCGEDITAMANRDALDKVFTNLIGNAVHYMRETSNRKITVACYDRGNEIECQIVDNGLGIPANMQDSVFEKFIRGANVGEIRGTGLGLAIVKSAVDAHGGGLRFESKVNEGTTFFFTLPKT